MVNYAKKEGRWPPAPKLPTSEVIILCVGISMLSRPPQICQPPDFHIICNPLEIHHRLIASKEWYALPKPIFDK